jgi:IS5 family transposase
MSFRANLLFSDKELLNQAFLQTDVGELYQAIPFDDLASLIPAPPHAVSGRGRKPWFDVKGGIGLQILKHYLGISDELLIERINTDWSLQLFCGISLRPGERINDTNLPSDWRSYIGRHLDIFAFQKQLCNHWSAHMNFTHIGMQDATCYESRISYPTDIKLLWGSCEDVYKILQEVRHHLHLRKSRCNMDKRRMEYLSYQKRRKKSKREEKKMRKKLLKFLLRLLNLLEKQPYQLSFRKEERIRTIVKVYEQQHHRAYGDPKEPIKDRIVSLGKPYIRPIVRGKEVKSVEFGAKVNKLQVDGISFIEYLSYDAFNETTRYKSGIELQEELFGECTHQAADGIYASNENRKYATRQGIHTNFIPKGKQKEQYVEQARILRKELNRERATVLEGSFGNEKNHYLLQKVNARTQHTETCWIFFGMMTANISIIAQRMATKKLARAA